MDSADNMTPEVVPRASPSHIQPETLLFNAPSEASTSLLSSSQTMPSVSSERFNRHHESEPAHRNPSGSTARSVPMMSPHQSTLAFDRSTSESDLLNTIGPCPPPGPKQVLHPSIANYLQAHPRRSLINFGPYILLQTLGEGEFGKVKLGVHKDYGEEVAVKLIRRGNIDNDSRLLKVEREIDVLRVSLLANRTWKVLSG